jgi:hypothetical protein
MNRLLVLALAAAGLLAAAPVAVPQAKPAAPPPTSPAVTSPSTIPNLTPALKAPVIVPVQPQPYVTTAPQPSAISRAGLSEASAGSGAAASPPPAADTAGIPAPGAGYDPCLHPTNPPDYCKRDAQ